MNRKLLFLTQLFFAVLTFADFSNAQSQSDLSEYVLGSGDGIRIQVYGEPDLTVETQLSGTGILSYPFLGELRLLGITIADLETEITDGLAGDYLINPKVTVSILRYRNFYVNGEVTRPGGFTFQPGLTVRKAISLAGGFTERASKKEIYVISEGNDSNEPTKVSLNSTIKPGDIITIEQSFF